MHKAIQPYGDVPILAAGGIVTGQQMAAAMAMGASGAWCGSVWLTTVESEVPPVIKEKMVEANSSQTVRSRPNCLTRISFNHFFLYHWRHF